MARKVLVLAFVIGLVTRMDVEFYVIASSRNV